MQRQSAVKGRLSGNITVNLAPETLRYSNVWHEVGPGMAEPDSGEISMVRLFSDLCGEYRQPFVIDVGAHVGTFPLAVTQNPNVTGWAFEPQSPVYEVLQANVALNGLETRISVFNTALSNITGRCMLRIPLRDNLTRWACTGDPNFGPFRECGIESVTLDEFAEAHGLKSVDIMRIDTEGSELSVLLGATGVITKHLPDLLLNINWSKCAQSKVFGGNILGYLELLGYRGTWVGAEEMLFRHPARKRTFRGRVSALPEAGGLRVAIIKQRYDEFGPWHSVKYDRHNPLGLLEAWPSKYSYFEMTHLFGADWYVVPYCHDSKISRQNMFRYKPQLDSAVHCVDAENLPVSDYDVIISLDPILRPPTNCRTLFAYFQNEHHDPEYRRSLQRPLPGYDLFLDHMLSAPAWVYDIPQPVAFPYPRHSVTARSLCGGPVQDSVWIDNRLMMMLAHGTESPRREGNEPMVAHLEQRFGMPVRSVYADYNDLKGLTAPAAYLSALAQCRYYLNLAACGAGQGLVDAASLGLVCFGTPKLQYHQAICHPFCLCHDLVDFERKFHQVRGSSALRDDIIAWQDTMLSDRFMHQPLLMLGAAVEKKRRKFQHSRSSDTQRRNLIAEISLGEEVRDTGHINYLKLKEMARLEYESGRYDAVLDHCQQALWFNPADAELHLLMACACFAQKNLKRSLSYLDKCLGLDANNKQAHALLQLFADNPVKFEYIADLEAYNQLRGRLGRLLDNNLVGLEKSDTQYLEQYNAILDEQMTSESNPKSAVQQLSHYHLKIRLDSIIADGIS